VFWFQFIMPVRRRAYSSRRRYAPQRSLRFVQDAVSYVLKAVPTSKASQALVVAGATVNGVRRVCRFDFSVATLTGDCVFALVYVPEGIQIANLALNVSTDNVTSLYVPEQHVILSGVASPMVSRFFSYQSRSLASNDQVYLLARSLGEGEVVLSFRCSFAVAFG
jgi:hypothetical protein